LCLIDAASWFIEIPGNHDVSRNRRCEAKPKQSSSVRPQTGLLRRIKFNAARNDGDVSCSRKIPIMPRAPNSLLARTVALIGALLVASLAVWLTLFTLAEQEPRARQIATRAAAVVNLTRAALLAAQPERRQALLRELSQREGIRIVPLEPQEYALPPPDRGMPRRIWQELQAQLGEDTLLIADATPNQAADDEALWISFALGPDDYWLVLPRAPHRDGLPWQWIGWGALTLLLAFAGGWLVVARINRPLRDAADVAARVGCGDFAVRLDQHGPDELAALARAFNRMSADLGEQESNRALLLAGLSHDLRTPLARLRLAVEMQVADAQEREAMIRDMDDMDTLSRQFSAFARAENEAASPVDLDALCRELAAGYAARGLPVTVRGAAGTASVPAHGLRRSLSNLLENAHRHGQPPVTLELARSADAIHFTVVDQGAGLDDAELETVKRPFWRGNAARTGAQGTGLGLAIVERYARQAGGRLDLSKRNPGLAACLSLPLANPAYPAPPPPRP
jgi:two-component system osmolarity sensor histidine kinase EnvZ